MTQDRFKEKAEAEHILKTDHLTRKFGSLTAVNDFTVEVNAGETFGLVGPNGAGKTTVIKILITLLPPTSGRAWVAGYDVTSSSSKVRRVIGYVPQLVSADGALTGYENLLIFSKLYGIPRSERRGRIMDALDFMGLAEFERKMVHDYSGGMIRRLEVAEAMLHRPRILFLDEPTVGLDPVARKAVWEHIKRLRDEYGTTIFLTTHYMEEADWLCSQVAVMHLGRMVALGSPQELKGAIGNPNASLEDVFIHYTGAEIESGGSFREASRTRRAARRLG